MNYKDESDEILQSGNQVIYDENAIESNGNTDKGYGCIPLYDFSNIGRKTIIDKCN